jgi:hypothetical protein
MVVMRSLVAVDGEVMVDDYRKTHDTSYDEGEIKRGIESSLGSNHS